MLVTACLSEEREQMGAQQRRKKKTWGRSQAEEKSRTSLSTRCKGRGSGNSDQPRGKERLKKKGEEREREVANQPLAGEPARAKDLKKEKRTVPAGEGRRTTMPRTGENHKTNAHWRGHSQRRLHNHKKGK